MRRICYFSLGTCIAALLLFAACGGGGGGDGGDGLTTLTIYADPDWDGHVTYLGFVGFSPSASFHCTGDRDATMHPGYSSRQLYAFHIGGLEAARIVRVTLRLHQDRVQGNPYGKYGDVVIDHVEYIGATGLPTFNDQTLLRRFAVLSTSPNLGARTLNVTDQVVRNLGEAALYSQYRLRFWSEVAGFSDDVDDFAQFAFSENPSQDKRPRLIVEYR